MRPPRWICVAGMQMRYCIWMGCLWPACVRSSILILCVADCVVCLCRKWHSNFKLSRLSSLALLLSFNDRIEFSALNAERGKLAEKCRCEHRIDCRLQPLLWRTFMIFNLISLNLIYRWKKIFGQRRRQRIMGRSHRSALEMKTIALQKGEVDGIQSVRSVFDFSFEIETDRVMNSVVRNRQQATASNWRSAIYLARYECITIANEQQWISWLLVCHDSITVDGHSVIRANMRASCK